MVSILLSGVKGWLWPGADRCGDGRSREQEPSLLTFITLYVGNVG